MVYALAAVLIPDLNIIALLAVGFSSILCPFVLYFFIRKKFSLHVIPFGAGCAAYLVFVLLIEKWVGELIYGEGSGLRDALIANPALYMLYLGFLTGILEEGGCYLIFRFLKKKFTTFSTALSVALGFSAIESIVLVGVRFVAYSWLAMQNNAEIMSGLSARSADPALSELFITLSMASPVSTLISGLELILFSGIHIGLFSLVWYSVDKPGLTYLLYGSILLHAMFMAPSALQEIRVIDSTAFYLISMAVLMILSLTIAYYVRRADIRNRSKDSDPFSIF